MVPKAKEKEQLNFLMVIDIRETLSLINFMEKVNTFMQMVIISRNYLKMVDLME